MQPINVPCFLYFLRMNLVILSIFSGRLPDCLPLIHLITWKWGWTKIFLKKISPEYLHVSKMLYLCSVKTKTMGYGVMVTLQILVLSFLVRIQVAQRRKRLFPKRGNSLFSLCLPPPGPPHPAISREKCCPSHAKGAALSEKSGSTFSGKRQRFPPPPPPLPAPGGGGKGTKLPRMAGKIGHKKRKRRVLIG